MTDKKLEVALAVLVILTPLIGVLVEWARRKVGAYLQVEIDNKKLAGVMTRANDLLWTLMLEAEQTLVRAAKAAKAADSDGGEAITEAEGRAIKEAVILNFKRMAGQKGLEDLMGVLGFEAPEMLTDWLGAKLESMVATKKLAEAGNLRSIDKVGEVLKANFK